MSEEYLLKFRILNRMLSEDRTVESGEDEFLDRIVPTVYSKESALDFSARVASELLADRSARAAHLQARLRSIETSATWRVMALLTRLTPTFVKRMLRKAAPLRHYLKGSSPIRAVDARPSKRAYRGERVAIVSLFRHRCGIRRGAELMVRDFRARGIEVFPIDVSAELGQVTNTQFPDLVPPSRLGELGVTDVIVHLNPPEFLNGLKVFAPAALRASAVVAYWAWELPVVAQEWRESAKYCDEIWVPSPFVRQALSSGIPRFRGQIKVVPHAVERDPLEAPTDAQRREARLERAIEPSAFVVGYSFSFDSNYSRKNPIAAIDAFRWAFPDDERCTLVIRCSDGKSAPRLFNHLVSYAGADPRIRIVNVDSSSFPIADFYWCLDVYLAPFRSEGYGLNVMEAAQAGVTVITTSWGLSPEIAARSEVKQIGYRLVPALDFQGFYDRLEGAEWAEPDLFDAVRELRLAREAKSRRSGQRTDAQPARPAPVAVDLRRA